MSNIVVSKNHNWNKIRQTAKSDIDAKAASARSALMTAAHGQDYVYQEKYAEAQAYLTPGADQTPQNYPFLWAEAQAAGTSMAQAASAIKNARGSLNRALADIELSRRQAKLAVDRCENKIATIRAVVDQLVFTPTPGQ